MSDTSTQPELRPLAGILAWAWPGLGHISIGQKRRGVLIMAGMLFMILTGLFAGGLDSVDRREDRLWFIAQAGCGPVAFVLDIANQSMLKAGRPPTDPARLNTVSMGRPNEMGTLFIALAGLMNVIVVLDAAFFDPKRSAGEAPERMRRRRSDRRPAKTPDDDTSDNQTESNEAAPDDA
ncbi:MAG: DUF6677 family protein [Planctomycetota bacterium]